MQLLLTLENTGIADIPVNYNYAVQSAIFALLAEENADYAAHLHDVAYGGKMKYKFFTFGSLMGKNHFLDKKLYYEGDIRLEVRSASAEFIQIFIDAVSRAGQLCLGDHCFPVKSMNKKELHITDSFLQIRTVSPIIAKRQTEDNKSVYYSPRDVRFIRRVRETFENKYAVFSGQKPQTSVDILPVSADRKVVTKYKDTWITAYHGVFQLFGAPEHLQFLYDVGLGVKTAQGFGMFEILAAER